MSEHDEAFDRIQKTVAEGIKSYHPMETDTICVLTDASTIGWGGVVTCVRKWKKDKPVEEQDHLPVAFHSGIFKGSQINWGIQCKEAFAIRATLLKQRYDLLSKEFKLFCDNRNLTYIYEPRRVLPSDPLPRSTESRLLRWCEDISNFKFKIFHIKGEQNAYADMLSRFGNPEYEQAIITKFASCVSQEDLPRVAIAAVAVNHSGYSPMDDSFARPTVDTIKESQKLHRRSSRIERWRKPETMDFTVPKGNLTLLGSLTTMLNSDIAY